ncbi:hypothetical protein K2173_011932 [Erythroxylum novogranatense]|uniref:TCP domain-containing protein n=1 Tax=Erythroxylum novogranatense TaxID=1862640 RepID=A0AAV8TEF6_9ROSI|nr:hypothetical protein K2173_011932 [Erythroxylum novogranatense]
MGDNHRQATTSSRLGLRSGRGEIVEVQGGHIVRSTGRKDRHSKVCTAKGPRDRRVRLAAHTAIQFYDVQDRLGYDRPSKAVDWLIKKAKTAIDELAELPTWDRTTAATNTSSTKTRATQQQHEEEEEHRTSNENQREYHFSMQNIACPATVSNRKQTATIKPPKTTQSTTVVVSSDVPNKQQQQPMSENNPSSFLPPSLDSDSIADTIKSFFPMGASMETSTSPIQFQSYSPDLLSRTSSQAQDLRLSLHSFQEPILLPHHGHTQSEHQVFFSGTAAQSDLGFDGSSGLWSENHQRLVAWNAGDANNGGIGGGGGGFIFNTPPLPPPLLQPVLGQNQLFTQRGPLQSSNTPSIRAWMDPAITVAYHHHSHHEMSQVHHQQDQSGISGIGFGLSGFRIPARIQGEEEEHGGIHNRPSSASSDSRH